jgi:hypothetical protein
MQSISLHVITECAPYDLLESSCFDTKILNLAAPELKRLVAGFPPRLPGFKPGSSHVGFVVDKVALGQVFSEYFDFPCQSFLQIFHHHNHPGLAQKAY